MFGVKRQDVGGFAFFPPGGPCGSPAPQQTRLQSDGAPAKERKAIRDIKYIGRVRTARGGLTVQASKALHGVEEQQRETRVHFTWSNANRRTGPVRSASSNPSRAWRLPATSLCFRKHHSGSARRSLRRPLSGLADAFNTV
ncbi:hypothetical protein EYF80_025933 [Liparis tanakae]|uniref:Uncharacterized protein n=1 Tax=Liparis tanakae TaxID=230148 RepID=A0A4Z2HG18_9TELE|nr:hypothetical protein EYF80_025933 [Liparis tanakae]